MTDNMPDNGYSHLLKKYAGYAPVYDHKFARYNAGTLRKTLELIPAHSARSLIDVACGTGIFIDMLRRQRPNIRTVGVDLSPEMLGRARQRLPADPQRGIEWLIGRAEQLPVEDGAFDILTCSNAFHLVHDSRAALAEFQRVLKPAGMVVLVDWCRDYPAMAALRLVQKLTDRHRRHVRTLQELALLVEQAGFEVHQRERFTVPPLWGLMCLVGRSRHMKTQPAAGVLQAGAIGARGDQRPSSSI